MKKIVEIETTIAASADAVWRAMTAADTALFPDARVETDWRVGHPIRFSGTWKGKAYSDRGEVVAADPGAKLTFTHWRPLSGTEDRPENYHTVSYVLSAEADGTRVRLSQFNHAAADVDDKTRKDYTANWRMMLDHLKHVVEAGA